MQSKYTLIGIFLLMMGLQSCYSPQKLLDKQRYTKAINKAVKQYKKNPSQSNLITIAKQAYEAESESRLMSISKVQQSNNDLKYESILSHYNELQSLYRLLGAYTTFCDVIHPVNYQNEIVQYTDMATNVRLERGQSLMNGNNKKDFQTAFFEFEKALQLTPNDKNIQMEREEAFAMGVTNVMVDFIHFKEILPRADREQIEKGLTPSIFNYLHQHQQRQFLQFYTLPEIYDLDLRTDQTVLSSVERFNITKFRDKVERRKVSKTISSKEVKNGKDVNVEKVVTAELTITTKSIKPQMRIHLAIVNAENRTIGTDIIEESIIWEHTWATFTGDKSALSDSDIQLLGNPPSRIPNDAQFIDQLLSLVRPKMEQSLNNIYRRWNF